ncbi:hypothetical protein [Peribacillus frigoritolerans]|uniref:hypothetical protein n=1 Tax=Peribacillus frigoritolerans TaxID=450367 RepID=UPI0024C1F917|nr:hypothetical protein [Peribacillus frigoritolerans]MDM5306987.1 hypothetical protein [Peribacillus frigoritolerans]WHX60009.1 hypothetical protein QNH33_15310 [Peribacillus frigoritolerans]
MREYVREDAAKLLDHLIYPMPLTNIFLPNLQKERDDLLYGQEYEQDGYLEQSPYPDVIKGM